MRRGSSPALRRRSSCCGPGLAATSREVRARGSEGHGKADFSGIDGTRDLYIGFVIHQAFVDVNEKGTEAAAATAVGMRAGGVPPKPIAFTVDRPFHVHPIWYPTVTAYTMFRE